MIDFINDMYFRFHMWNIFAHIQLQILKNSVIEYAQIYFPCIKERQELRRVHREYQKTFFLKMKLVKEIKLYFIHKRRLENPDWVTFDY